jgi:hypothetical protein
MNVFTEKSFVGESCIDNFEPRESGRHLTAQPCTHQNSEMISQITVPPESAALAATHVFERFNLTDENNEKRKSVVIKKFTPELIRPNHRESHKLGGSTIVISGKPGFGKSTLLTGLIFSKKDIIPAAVAVNGSEDFNHFYKQFFPKQFVTSECSLELLDNIFERQRILLDRIKNGNETNLNPWLMLILDDCTADPAVFKTVQQNHLFKNGRQMNILYILSFQYVCDLPVNIRSCVSGVFLFKETSVKNLKKLYENFAAVIPTFSIFRKLMSSVTGDYRCLFIDNVKQSNEWIECVYHCKTPSAFTKIEKDKVGQFGSENFRNSSTDETLTLFLPTVQKMKKENNLLVRTATFQKRISQKSSHRKQNEKTPVSVSEEK